MMRKQALLAITLFLLVLPLSFALTIEQNSVQVVSDTSVQLTIVTNPDSIVHIYYSTDATAESMQLQANPGSTRKTTHDILLEGLAPGQRYYYQITAFNSQESIVDDNNGAFYTFLVGQEAAPGQAPIISDVRAEALGPASTAIRWTTDVAADATVHYGIGNTDDVRDRQSTATQHELIIPTQSGENYQFYVVSCTEGGVCSNPSELQAFLAGTGQGPLAMQLEATISATSARTSMDIPAQSIPYAKLEVFVDGMRKRVSNAADTGADGFVLFYDIPLTPGQVNEVKVVASDATGTTAEVIQQVIVDVSAPQITLNNVPAVTSEPLTLTGSVSEAVDAIITVELVNAPTLPLVGQLRNETAAGADEVDLRWNLDQTYSSYALYANGQLVAEVPQEAYRFTRGAPGTTILFTVAGVTPECRISEQSAGLNIQFSGSDGQLEAFTPVSLACQTQPQSVQVDGDFSLPVHLLQGQNLVTIKFIDNAGNIAQEVFEILYDTQAPSFIMEETNIDELSPIYDDVANIRGKVSEEAAVHIFVNEDIDRGVPTYIVSTDHNGYFHSEVELHKNPDFFETSVPVEPGVGSAESSGWRNRVKIKAIDLAGFESADETIYDLMYAQCGQSGAFTVNIEPPTRMVHPDEVLDGTAEIYFNIHLDVADDTFEVNGREYPRYQLLRPPALHVPLLSREQQAEIEQLSQVGAPTIIWDRDFKHGVASVSVHGYDFAGNEPDNRQEKLDMISSTNEGECAAGLLGDLYGCIQVPLELEIQYAENRPGYATTPEGGVISQTGQGGAVTGDFLTENKVQKVCYPEFEVAIDQQISLPDMFPDAFEGTAKKLDDAVNMIDKVLEPIRKIEHTLFLLWGGTQVVQWVQGVNVAWQCTGRPMTALFEGQAPFNVDIAASGLCVQHYPAAALRETEQCLKCSQAIYTQKRLQGFSNSLGDRLACPAAPSLQTYIKEQKQTELGAVSLLTGGTFKTGSSCADPQIGTNYQSLQSVYDNYKDQDKYRKKWYDPRTWGKTISPLSTEDLEIEDKPYIYNPTRPNCYGLHPSDSRCCGVEYMQEWNSACLGMNELKQSVCLAAQNENVDPSEHIRYEEISSGIEAPTLESLEEEPLQCPKVFNALAGMCETRFGNLGGVAPAHLRTGMFLQLPGDARTTIVSEEQAQTGSSPAPEPNTLDPIDTQGYAHPSALPSGNPELIVRVARVDVQRGLFTQEGGQVQVDRGYFYYNTQSSPVLPSDPSGDSIIQDQKRYHKQIDLSRFFVGDTINQQQAPADFIAELCKGDVKNCNNPTLAQSLWVQIKNELGTNEKPYIVDPTSSLLRSTQCVCLGGVHKSLELWRGRLATVSSCFKQTQYSGNGDPSSCQEVLSTSICDIFIDALRCFVNSVGGQPSARIGGGTISQGLHTIGLGFVADTFTSLARTGQDFVGAMRQGFTGVTDSVTSRYGGTSLYKNLFIEKKFVNSVCLWSFTGTYDLDINSIISESINDIPIEPQPFIWSAEREFINPGYGVNLYPTHRYTVPYIIDAGADVNYQLQLVCSADYTCTSNTGGRCDCAGAHDLGNGEVVRSVESGSLSSGENFDKLYEANIQEAVRFDKVRLTYQYVNNQGQYVEGTPIEKKISVHGASPPAYCQFRTTAGAFTCQFDETISGAGSVRFRNPDSIRPAQDAFILDQPIKFDGLSIVQDIPGLQQCNSGACQFTKYLVWDIKNQHGQLVASNYNLPDPTFVLNNDGEDIIDDDIIRFDGTWMNVQQGGQYNPSTCDVNSPNVRQEQFSITFTLYDAGEAPNGGGWTRSNAISVFDGEYQQKTIPFTVICTRDGGAASSSSVTGVTSIQVSNAQTGAQYGDGTDGRVPPSTPIRITLTTEQNGGQHPAMVGKYDAETLTFSKSLTQAKTWFADVNSGDRIEHVLTYQFTKYNGQPLGEGTHRIQVGGAGSTSLTGEDHNDNCLLAGTCDYYFYWLPIHGWPSMSGYEDAAREGSHIFDKATPYETDNVGYLIVRPEQMSQAGGACQTLLTPPSVLTTPEQKRAVLDQLGTCAAALRDTLGVDNPRGVIGFSYQTPSSLFGSGSNLQGYGIPGEKNVLVTKAQLTYPGIAVHEMGHMFGLCDVYSKEEYDNQGGDGQCPNPPGFPDNTLCPDQENCKGWPQNQLHSTGLPNLNGFCTGSGQKYGFMGDQYQSYCGFHNTYYTLIGQRKAE